MEAAQKSVQEEEATTSIIRASCDRRLSRAARKLVLQHLKRSHMEYVTAAIVAYDQDKQSKKSGMDYDAAILWSVLEKSLQLPSVINSTSSQCKLIPSLDMYHRDIHNVRTIPLPSLSSTKFLYAYPSSTIRHRLKYSKRDRQPSIWYQCMYCGKLFMTQYYLDLHIGACSAKHEDQSNSDSTSISKLNGEKDMQANYYCPATSWCAAFGKVGCYEMAMTLEPYYDRGSSGWGDDRTFVQHSLVKQKEEQLRQEYDSSNTNASSSSDLLLAFSSSSYCTNESIAMARMACHKLFNDCGLSSAAEYCKSDNNDDYWLHLLHCPMAGHHNRHSWSLLDHWQTEWSQELERQERWRILGVVVIIIGVSIWYCTTQLFYSRTRNSLIRRKHRQSNNKNDQSGRRLLNKRHQTKKKKHFLNKLD